MARRTREERRHLKVLRFQPCEGCSYDIATGEGERSCHYYGCPYLPEELDVRCPDCGYDAFTGEGAASCSDPPTCSFVRDVAPTRVATVREWMALRQIAER
jgi:hypothetical protein